MRSELHRAITPAIRKRCEDFVLRGDSVGRGVKQRIIELFRDLAFDSTKAAEAPAKKILKSRFDEVREQIDAAFQEWGDPLDETVDALAATHQQHIRRSDAQRRGRILEEIDRIRTAQIMSSRNIEPNHLQESAA